MLIASLLKPKTIKNRRPSIATLPGPIFSKNLKIIKFFIQKNPKRFYRFCYLFFNKKILFFYIFFLKKKIFFNNQISLKFAQMRH